MAKWLPMAGCRTAAVDAGKEKQTDENLESINQEREKRALRFINFESIINPLGERSDSIAKRTL